MAKKKNTPKSSKAKATDAVVETKTTNAAKPTIEVSTKEDVKKPESNTAEPNAKTKGDEKAAFPLYTLLAAGTVIVATYFITENMWSRDIHNTTLMSKKVEKPAVHIVSGEEDTGELTPLEIDNILSGASPVTPTPNAPPESYKAIQTEQVSDILPPQDMLEAAQDALEDMIDDATDSAELDKGISGQRIEKIERKFSKLSDKVKQLRSENRSLKRQLALLKKEQQNTILNAAISGLSFAITNGESFEAPLEKLANMQDTPITISRGIATLDALPTRQVVKAEELSERLTQTARDYHTALAAGENTSVWAKTLHNLTSSIHIRKVGSNHEGDDDGAIIARAEAQIDAGDIDEALAELSQLSPNAAEFFASWVTLANEHQTANAVAGRLIKHLAQGDAS